MLHNRIGIYGQTFLVNTGSRWAK